MCDSVAGDFDLSAPGKILCSNSRTREEEKKILSSDELEASELDKLQSFLPRVS